MKFEFAFMFLKTSEGLCFPQFSAEEWRLRLSGGGGNELIYYYSYHWDVSPQRGMLCPTAKVKLLKSFSFKKSSDSVKSQTCIDHHPHQGCLDGCYCNIFFFLTLSIAGI